MTAPVAPEGAIFGTPYVSQLESRWLAEQPEQRHRRLNGTLMSADLSGFTAMSERLAARGKEGAERLTTLVNDCFTALINAATLESGDVLKFGGDALLLWFDGDEHPIRAARAAGRMQRAIGAARFKQAGLRMSIGAHSGDVDMFLVGPPARRELVLAGPAVSATVELESAATAGGTLISPELAALLPSHWCGGARGSGVELNSLTLPRPRRSAPSATSPTPRLSPPVNDDLDALERIGGEHRMATVVFAELEGTDARIAADVSAIAASIDDLIHAVLDLSARYRLHFLYTDVIADGIKVICTAGAPLTTGEDEESGLRFATDLVAGDPQHRLRVGVNRGRVFAGFLGSRERHTFTVMGDPVNLSARLMAKASEGEVVASDDVVRRCRATFRLTPLAPFLVKGKQTPVHAHLVGRPTGERRGQLQLTLPLVGREAELSVLQDAIESAANGHGRVVEVSGEAGIGKTRLLEAIADDPRLVGRVATECQPYDGLAAYASARTLLRRVLGIPHRASPAAAGKQLQATASRIAPDILPMLPLVAVAVGADVPATPEATGVAERFRAARLHEAAVALLSAALPQTTLLVVEDVYYADDASLALFMALAERIADRPWLLTLTRRPDGDGLLGAGVPGTLIQLEALADDAAATLSRLASGGGALHPLEQEEIAQRAGGNPLFLLQLLSASREDGDTELPESIERVVATRIDRLPGPERTLLRQAAVIGRIFSSHLLDALHRREYDDVIVPQRWELLSDLLEPAGTDQWRFRHALFRDVAYEGLAFARRRRMHRQVGELLEQGFAGAADVALLAEHFWRAGDSERTWRYSVAAGDQAWAAYATTQAIAAYRRALTVRVPTKDPQERSRIAESLGDVCERAGRYDEALVAYRTARRWARRSDVADAQGRLMRKVGVVNEHTGHYGQAQRWYQSAMRDAESRGARDEIAEAELCVAGLRLRQGRPAEMAQWATRAIDSAQRAGEDRAAAHGRLLMVAAAVYDPAIDAHVHGAAALEHFTTVADQHRRGKVLNNLGVIDYFRGDWDRAADLYREAAEALTAAGDVVEAATVQNNLAEIYSDQGHLERATELLEQSLATYASAAYPIGVALAQSNLGRAKARAGQSEEAVRLLEAARTGFQEIGAESYAVETSTRLAEALVLGGNPEAALAVLDTLEGTEGSSFPIVAVTRTRIRGWACSALGLPDRARSLFSQARDASRSADLPYEELLALRGLLQEEQPADTTWAEDADRIARRLGIAEVPQVPAVL
ncbi:tetratricopeptide repeat protein [Nocardioides limicola]|uniref:tetratricopeptide repeat protein n=1 Tax=Nocardioides limicola TaxID=2803368 RepID=UPI00193BC6FA|nr:tetratricopeptide repeat protein [Nocardioides sp. DJM-14]